MFSLIFVGMDDKEEIFDLVFKLIAFLSRNAWKLLATVHFVPTPLLWNDNPVISFVGHGEINISNYSSLTPNLWGCGDWYNAICWSLRLTVAYRVPGTDTWYHQGPGREGSLMLHHHTASIAASQYQVLFSIHTDAARPRQYWLVRSADSTDTYLLTQDTTPFTVTSTITRLTPTSILLRNRPFNGVQEPIYKTISNSIFNLISHGSKLNVQYVQFWWKRSKLDTLWMKDYQSTTHHAHTYAFWTFFYDKHFEIVWRLERRGQKTISVSWYVTTGIHISSKTLFWGHAAWIWVPNNTPSGFWQAHSIVS